MSDRIQQALELAERIVRIQGIRYIKSLLREKKEAGFDVRIGNTKSDTTSNLKDAIVAGIITLEDLESWIAEVEGWGKQHVYLFSSQDSEPLLSGITSKETLIDFVNLRGIKYFKNPNLFPSKLTLAEPDYEDGTLIFTWKMGEVSTNRAKDKDYDKNLEGFTYTFKAWREDDTRRVVRLVIWKEEGKAALFNQFPLGIPHHEAIDASEDLMRKLGVLQTLSSVSISKIIKLLDEAIQSSGELKLENELGYIVSHNTRFGFESATIEFGSEAGSEDPYFSVEPVRHVRHVVTQQTFFGRYAMFKVSFLSGVDKNRTIKMLLNAIRTPPSIYFYARIGKKSVWAVIHRMLDLIG